MKIKNRALIIFYDEEKQILMQDRRSISKAGEEWGFFGGSAEEGETPEENLVREVKEELSFDITDYEFVTLFEAPLASDNSILGVFHIFKAPLSDKMDKFDQKEGDGMKLFSLDEAAKLTLVPGDYELIAVLKEKL